MELILVPGNLPNEYKEFFNKFPIYYISEQTLETANGPVINESKFVGSICLKLVQGFTVVVANAETYLSKKGKLSLQHNIISRIGNCIDFYFLDNLHHNPKFDNFIKYIHKSKIPNLIFENLTPVENFTELPVPDDIVFTCGLNTTHLQNNDIITGHITRGYGITFNESVSAMDENSYAFNNKFKGETIQLELVDEKGNKKYGGSVVWVPELGSTSHITVNTLIKAALSKQIVEKYIKGTYSFSLKDIDNTSKQNITVNISKGPETEVTVNSWYAYVIS